MLLKLPNFLLEVFLKVHSTLAAIAHGQRLCHFVNGGLIETQRLFHEQGIFNICTISIQMSLHSEKHQLQARIIIAALPPSSQSTHVSVTA